MKTLPIHIGLCLLLLFVSVPASEGAILGQLVESLWARLERIWESSLLRGPLKFLTNLRTVKLVRSVVRFFIETVVNMPFKATMRVIDFVCDTLTNEGLIGKSGLVKAEDLGLILVDDEGTERIGLDSLQKIASSSRFNPDRDLVIFIPGWTQRNETFDPTTQELVDAFNQRYDKIFSVLDIGDILDNLYTWAAYNTREAGNFLGIHLSKIVNVVPAERIHLIGAGLGAQIAGFAGKKFHGKTSKRIGRITGLDPSRPCFGNNGLDSSAAEFVDIIHSSKLFGTIETRGHVDFFANRISTVLPSKGCKSFFCLHQQAVLYLAEALISGQEGNFCAVSCESRNRFEMGHCDHKEQIYMGLWTPKDARGSFYLNTNARSPYGKCSRSLTTTDSTAETTTAENSDDGSNNEPSETTAQAADSDPTTTTIAADPE